MLEEKGITMKKFIGSTLLHPDDLPFNIKNIPKLFGIKI